MSTFIAVKAPADVVTLDIEWQEYLPQAPLSEFITISSWAISGPDSALVVDASSIKDYEDSSPIQADLVTRVTLSGGTAGRTYVARNTITTSEDQIFTRSITVRVENR